MNRWWIGILTLGVAVGCTEAPSQTPVPTAENRHIDVILDRSSSITPAETGAARGTIMRIVEDLTFGDRFSMLVAHSQGVRHGTAEIDREMPNARNPA